MDSVRLHHKFLENETDENKNKCTKQEIILESQKVNFSTIYTKEWLNKKKTASSYVEISFCNDKIAH